MIENEQFIDAREKVDEEVADLDNRLVEELADAVGEVVKPDVSALDVTGLTDQALKLSNNEQYIETLDMIRSDPSLSVEEKVQLIAAEDARQQEKIEVATKQASALQASQVEAYWNILRPYVNLGLSVAAVLVLYKTPAGREFLTKLISNAVKDLPRLARTVAT